jgi:hypothetical protein
VNAAAEHSPPYTAGIFQELQEDVERVFDLKKMVTDTLMEDVELINKIFLKCGAPEFAFIKRRCVL